MLDVMPAEISPDPFDQPNALVTPDDVAAFYRITRRHVLHLNAEGQLPAVKCGKLVRFRVSDVLAYIDANRHPAA